MDVTAIPVLVIVPQFGGRWHGREDPLGRKFNVILGAIGALTLVSASSAIGPAISSQAAPGVNFSAYRTYSWVNTMPPAGLNPVMYQQILADIDAQMSAKGYQKGDPGELSLVLTIGAQEKTDVQSWGRFGLQTSIYQYTEGQLSLDVFDSKSQQALWHGQATETVDPAKPKPSKVQKAIAKLMADFPATAAMPAAASSQ